MSGSRRGRRQGWERERQTDRERKRKITNTKKFMEFYLVVLHSAELKDRKRDELGEREKDITRRDRIL